MKEYPRMDPDLKKKWVEALKSGKYKQGQGRLKGTYDEGVTYGFCCIGVLCDIINPEGWIRHPDNPRVFIHELGNFGISKSDNYISERIQGFLMQKNDSRSISWAFSQIADWIDANL